ncbi:hypothetical protein D3C72_2453280 [compost metagenome]
MVVMAAVAVTLSLKEVSISGHCYTLNTASTLLPKMVAQAVVRINLVSRVKTKY